MPTSNMSKTCAVCYETKPISGFQRRKGGAYDKACKACSNKAAKAGRPMLDPDWSVYEELRRERDLNGQPRL